MSNFGDPMQRKKVVLQLTVEYDSAITTAEAIADSFNKFFDSSGSAPEELTKNGPITTSLFAVGRVFPADEGNKPWQRK